MNSGNGTKVLVRSRKGRLAQATGQAPRVATAQP